MTSRCVGSKHGKAGVAPGPRDQLPFCRFAVSVRGEDSARAAELAYLGALALGRADADQDEIGIRRPVPSGRQRTADMPTWRPAVLRPLTWPHTVTRPRLLRTPDRSAELHRDADPSSISSRPVTMDSCWRPLRPTGRPGSIGRAGRRGRPGVVGRRQENRRVSVRRPACTRPDTRSEPCRRRQQIVARIDLPERRREFNPVAMPPVDCDAACRLKRRPQRQNSASRMMMGMGTPSSQSRIERPMRISVSGAVGKVDKPENAW